MAPADTNRLDARLLTGLWLIIVVSAVGFIVVVQAPVFDDSSNLVDVIRYSHDGISITTLRQHFNPAGPFAYIWIAINGKLLGSELWSFHLVNALSMFVLGGMLLWIGNYHPVVLASTCLLLVNPYLPLASATILTEVPSLLALTLGALLWFQGLSNAWEVQRHAMRWQTAAKLLIGGALLGLSITGRQYYVAILPAMAVTVLIFSMNRPESVSRLSVVLVLAAGLSATLPIFALFIVWGGLTSPSMQEAISYPNYTAKLGLNPLRPVTAALYVGIYVLPVLVLQRDIRLRVLGLLALPAVIIVGLITLIVPQDYLWCTPSTSNACGPISGLYNIVAARAPGLALAYNGIVALVGCGGILLFIRAVWSGRAAIVEIPGVVFGLAVLAFFVIEQAFVGGNIPFYERYILQIAPILGLALSANRQFAIDRALIGSAPLILLGQFRLWHNV